MFVVRTASMIGKAAAPTPPDMEAARRGSISAEPASQQIDNSSNAVSSPMKAAR